MIGRRDLLRSVGASAALAALAPLAGCARSVARTGPAAVSARDPLRAALREAVAAMSARLDAPTAYLLERRRVRALVDVARADVADEHVTICVLAGTTRGARRARLERCFDDVTPARIGAVARELLAAAPAGPAGPARPPPAPVDRNPRPAVDPADLGPDDWLARARAIAARGDRLSSSRIVYRASYLACDDDRIWIVSGAADHAQRLVRTRLGTSFVAWHGSEPMVGEAEVAGAHGPDPALLSDAAIAAAAADALALYTPSAPPTGDQDVFLDPQVVATVVERGLPALLAGGGAPLSPLVTITDEPQADRFGRFEFDDEGTPARATPLVQAGAVVGGLGPGTARRSGPAWRLAPTPSNLVIAPGAQPAAAIERSVHAGLIVIGAHAAQLDDAGRVIVRARRARELAKGTRTGRSWDDVELRADLRALFGLVSAASAEQAGLALAGEGPPRAVVAPWLLTRARVGSARSAR